MEKACEPIIDVKIACEPKFEVKFACEPIMKEVENKPACESKQSEKVFLEIVKSKILLTKL